MIEMEAQDVLVRVSAADASQLAWFGRIVVLNEKDGNRVLPIWTGPPEGDLLFMALRGASTPRPMPHDLTADLVGVLGGRVERVAITDPSNVGYHAIIFPAVDARTADVDAGATDALLLAIRTGKPLLVSEHILEREEVAADKLSEKLPPRTVGSEVMAPGDWRSLSADLLRSLHRPPKQKLRIVSPRASRAKDGGSSDAVPVQAPCGGDSEDRALAVEAPGDTPTALAQKPGCRRTPSNSRPSPQRRNHHRPARRHERGLRTAKFQWAEFAVAQTNSSKASR
jgi:uncharacterized protein